MLEFPKLLISWHCQDVSSDPQSERNVTSCGEMCPALGFAKRRAEVRLLVV